MLLCPGQAQHSLVSSEGGDYTGADYWDAGGKDVHNRYSSGYDEHEEIVLVVVRNRKVSRHRPIKHPPAWHSPSKKPPAYGSCRAYALQKHRPLTLHATINLPSVAEDPSKPIAGFIHLVNLYRPFDDTFVGLWNKSRTDCSTLWLAHLQTQLSQALPAVLDGTETQAADLRASQHWLRTIVWQLSITNNFLSSTSSDSSMTFGYPIEIAKDLVAVTSQLSRRSMEVHGVGLVSHQVAHTAGLWLQGTNQTKDREDIRRGMHPD